MESKIGPAIAITIGIVLIWLTLTGKMQNLINAANGTGTSSTAQTGGSSSIAPQSDANNASTVSMIPGQDTAMTGDSADPTTSYLPATNETNSEWNTILDVLNQGYGSSTLGVPGYQSLVA